MSKVEPLICDGSEAFFYFDSNFLCPNCARTDSLNLSEAYNEKVSFEGCT